MNVTAPILERSFDLANLDRRTEVLLLAGQANALSLTRSLARRGIKVRVSGGAGNFAPYSRFCSGSYPVPRGVKSEEFWSDLLLSGRYPELKGSLLIYCSDAAITFVANNRDALSRDYVLDHSRPEMQIALLDKLETLKLADAAGVGTPQRWLTENENDLDSVRDEIRFPVLVKPLLSHEFQAIFGTKFFLIEDSYDELLEKARKCWAVNQQIMIVEQIPGPDTLLTSYYTYIDDAGKLYYDYTKRVIRRFPLNKGGGCYHASTWLPETADEGRKFFKAIGFTGFGNVEFKLDPRDNKLKIIEANARFTAAQELVNGSDAPIDLVYYCCATGQPAPRFSSFKQEVRYWYPLKDFRAFLELNSMGRLSFFEWIRSVFPFNHRSPVHQWNDPLPSFAAMTELIGAVVSPKSRKQN